MRAPRGLGWWVAFENAIDAGPKSDDLRIAIDRCLETGATWIAMRAGAGGKADASSATDDQIGQTIAALRAAGLYVAAWIFDYPATAAGEVSILRRWRALGADGAILNAEFEYQTATPAQARALVGSVRVLGFEFVAHAPPDYLGAGGTCPALVALDDACDAIMPQVYAWEHDDRGHAFHLDRVAAAYAKRGYGPDKVWPIGCSYRPKTRGFVPVLDPITGAPVLDGAGRPRTRPKNTPPLAGEAEAVARDLLAYLDHPAVRACPAPSVYSLDAVSWINGASDRTIDALASRARFERDTIPASPPDTDRPVAVTATLRADEAEHTPLHLRESADR